MNRRIVGREATVTHTSVRSDVSDVGLASTTTSSARRILLSPSAALLVVIAIFTLYGMTRSEQFLNVQTWMNILRDASFVGIAAMFGAMVMIGGGLDLSVGSVLLAGAMVSAQLTMMGWPLWLVIISVVVCGAILGVVNGVLVGIFRISAIIVTLGTLFIIKAAIIFGFDSSTIGPLSASFGVIGRGSVFGIPYLVLVAFAIGIVAHVLLDKTVFGFNLRAVGGNRESARSTGVNIRRIEILTYVLSGCAGAFVGLLQASWLGSGSPTLGSGFELKVIAAAIIGGTSIAGAIGTVSGAALGAVLLSVLGTGLVLLRVDATLQDVFIGLILILAAGLDQVRRRQMFRASLRTERKTAGSDRAET